MKSLTGATSENSTFEGSETLHQYTVKTLADFLGVDVSTVRRWIYSGKLPVNRMGGVWLIIIDEDHPPDCIKKYLTT